MKPGSLIKLQPALGLCGTAAVLAFLTGGVFDAYAGRGGGFSRGGTASHGSFSAGRGGGSAGAGRAGPGTQAGVGGGAAGQYGVGGGVAQVGVGGGKAGVGGAGQLGVGGGAAGTPYHGAANAHYDAYHHDDDWDKAADFVVGAAVGATVANATAPAPTTTVVYASPPPPTTVVYATPPPATTVVVTAAPAHTTTVVAAAAPVAVLPCSAVVIPVAGVSYYLCGSTYYTQTYAGGSVMYVQTAPPPGY